MLFTGFLAFGALLDISVQHTSASLTINENYDSDVRDDTETFLNKIVPEVCLGCFSNVINIALFHYCSMLGWFYAGF